MGIGKAIKDKATNVMVGTLIDQAVKFVQKDPQNNFDKLCDSLLKIEKIFPKSNGSFGKFVRWTNGNPGSKQWFIELLSRNEEQVRVFIRNMFVNVSLGWMQTNPEVEANHGLTAPYTILISPTMRCNLRCRGCYADDYSMNDDLPMPIVNRIIHEAKELGTHFFTILGGEPFVRFPELYEIFKEHSDCLFQVFTNGTLITEQVADQLAELKNVVVAFSVNGDESETEYMRGPGVYQKVLAGMERMKERNLLFGMSLVLTRHNFHVMTDPEFYLKWRDRGVVYAWNFLFMPVGKNPDLSLMPTPQQRYEYGEFIQKFRTQEPVYIMDFWADAPFVHGCIAGGRRYIHINSKGDVEPCIFVHFATDNIKEKPLVEALKSSFMADIRMHQPHTDNLLRPCMIIDNPSVLRTIVERNQAKPTSPGADAVVTELAEALDEYAQTAADYLDPIWKRDWEPNIQNMKDRKASYGEGKDRIQYRLDRETFLRNLDELRRNDPKMAETLLSLAELAQKEYGEISERQPVIVE
jgi:MoaA/NifB/PqqE/SkfB family radical SAM enzyme